MVMFWVMVIPPLKDPEPLFTIFLKSESLISLVTSRSQLVYEKEILKYFFAGMSIVK